MKKNSSGIVLGYSVAITAFYVMLTSPSLKYKDLSDIDCDFAHRGLWGRGVPENSLLAFQRAIDNNHGIELDLRLTKDNKVVVFHDTNLLRMCGVDRLVSEVTYKELKNLTLQKTNEKIPLFDEVLALVDGKVPLMVELKCETLNTTLSKCVANSLDKYSGVFCVKSFNSVLVRWFKKYRPHVIRGQLVIPFKHAGESKHTFLNIMMSLLMVNCISRPNFISLDKRFKLNPGLLSAIKLWGAKPYVWTVKGKEEMARLSDKGIRVIFEQK